MPPVGVQHSIFRLLILALEMASPICVFNKTAVYADTGEGELFVTQTSLENFEIAKRLAP